MSTQEKRQPPCEAEHTPFKMVCKSNGTSQYYECIHCGYIDFSEAIDSAKREVLEQIRPPQATIDSMKLTQPHKYRGVEYPCCSICGFCPEAINAFIDSKLEQSEESK